jgi:2-iminoacetate synthase
MDEVEDETKCLIQMGHKRVLVEFGEDPDFNNIDYICETIRAIYRTKVAGNNIRRVNINIAATTVENYKRLKAENIGTYQLFQETYHRPTYELLHKGPKGDFDRQIYAHNRAREAGLDDLGIGVLFGLYDWRFEVLSLIAHADYMERELGVGPHTISVPRFRPAPGINYRPAHPVSDADFLKLIAILRIAVPYTGIILSTREPAELRQMAFKLGVSQASAASICVPGGYAAVAGPSLLGGDLPAGQAGGVGGGGQFTIQDDRSVNDVVKSVIEDGLIPSFCTACYRVGRTGESFMELAKPGEIHKFCRPNAILTFAEYLEDFADNESKLKGEALIQRHLSMIDDPKLLQETKQRLNDIKAGKRDLYF